MNPQRAPSAASTGSADLRQAGRAQDPDLDLTVAPVTSNCRALYEQGDHALVGVSPANSSFSTARITRLARWSLQRFDDCHFVAWDEPYRNSLRALGYSESEARSKARKNYRSTRNRVTRALATAGVPSPHDHVLTWPVLNRNSTYRSVRANCYDLFDADPAFRDACLSVTRAYLASHQLTGSLTLHERLKLAVTYLLDEMPLFVDAPRILDKPSSVCCYHNLSRFEVLLFEGAFAMRPSPQQGRLVLRDINQAPHPSAAPGTARPAPAPATAP